MQYKTNVINALKQLDFFFFLVLFLGLFQIYLPLRILTVWLLSVLYNPIWWLFYRHVCWLWMNRRSKAKKERLTKLLLHYFFNFFLFFIFCFLCHWPSACSIMKAGLLGCELICRTHDWLPSSWKPLVLNNCRLICYWFFLYSFLLFYLKSDLCFLNAKKLWMGCLTLSMLDIVLHYASSYRKSYFVVWCAFTHTKRASNGSLFDVIKNHVSIFMSSEVIGSLRTLKCSSSMALTKKTFEGPDCYAQFDRPCIVVTDSISSHQCVVAHVAT